MYRVQLEIFRKRLIFSASSVGAYIVGETRLAGKKVFFRIWLILWASNVGVSLDDETPSFVLRTLCNNTFF